MVGSKHKNGIICTFPDCNKSMRTQKFKMHFTKAHLKDGEAYSVDHRRQYEVAREDSARSAVKDEVVPAAAPTGAISSTNVLEIPRVETISASNDNQTAQARQPSSVQQPQQIPLPSHQEAPDPAAVRSDDSSTGGPIQVVPASAQAPLPGSEARGTKRPAVAMEASTDTVDPTSVLLMQFIALMDQRFQELVGKMGEMIDVQKDLIDTLQASNPNGLAPASAFSHAVEVVMKRRKKDVSPRDDNDCAADDGDGSVDANGGNEGGFVL